MNKILLIAFAASAKTKPTPNFAFLLDSSQSEKAIQLWARHAVRPGGSTAQHR
jgi:hypothetical protein